MGKKKKSYEPFTCEEELREYKALRLKIKKLNDAYEGNKISTKEYQECARKLHSEIDALEMKYDKEEDA